MNLFFKAKIMLKVVMLRVINMRCNS